MASRAGGGVAQTTGQKPTSRTMVLPRGACVVGLKSNTLSNGPYLFTWTWKPAACRVWVACSTELPITYGTPTNCGPEDTLTTTVSPGRTSDMAAGSWPVMVPWGCWLLLSDCCCRFTPC